MTKDRSEYFKAYCKANKEKILERAREASRKRYAERKEEILEKAKENYQNNKEYYRQKNKEYDRKSYILSTPERMKRQYINQAKTRANKSGYDCDITIDDFELPTHCPLLGIELDYSRSKGYNPAQASLDKINPKLGYTRGNVWIISRKANTMKSNATREELCLFFKNLVKNNLL